MEQGIRDTNINITNGLRIGNELRQGVNYYLAKNEHDAVVVREAEEGITRTNDITRDNGYLLTRDALNGRIVPIVETKQISNVEDIARNRNYLLTRNENSQIVPVEESSQIQNLDDVRDNERYHITRSGGNVSAVSDNSLQLPGSNLNENPIFGIKKKQEIIILSHERRH